MSVLIKLFYLLLFITGLIFAVLNADLVTINFYFAKLTLPISILMTIILGIGLSVGILSVLTRYWRLKLEYSKLKKQLKLTETEIKNLRAIPLQDQH